MHPAFIVLSGGLDSSTVAYYTKHKLHASPLHCFFFNYKQRTLRQELLCAKRISTSIGASLTTINIQWLGKASKTLITTTRKTPQTTLTDLDNITKERETRKLWWVPCRNSVFLLSVLAYAESYHLATGSRPVIYSGIKREGRIPMKDTTPQFLKKINELAEEATYHGGYLIEAPLMDLDKDQVVALGEELHVPWQDTFSCYVGKGYTTTHRKKIPVHCGTCSNCRLRQTGFYWANIPDPTIYYEH